MKTCSTCGVQKPLDRFHKRPGTHDGLRHQCKDCMAPRLRIAKRKYLQTEHGKFKSLHHAAKVINVPVLLTEEEFMAVIASPCVYCGDKLPEVGYGLDRKDPKGVYEAGNVVACCKRCNWMKADWWSHDEFLKIGDTVSGLMKERACA